MVEVDNSHGVGLDAVHVCQCWVVLEIFLIELIDFAALEIAGVASRDITFDVTTVDIRHSGIRIAWNQIRHGTEQVVHGQQSALDEVVQHAGIIGVAKCVGEAAGGGEAHETACHTIGRAGIGCDRFEVRHMAFAGLGAVGLTVETARSVIGGLVVLVLAGRLDRESVGDAVHIRCSDCNRRILGNR